MKLSFEVSYFDPSGKIRFSAVREGWAEEDGTWRNPELGLEFAFRLEPDANGTVLRIPADSLRETGNCKFKELVVANSDFSGSEGDGGEFLIPWASGYLCRTSGHESGEYALPLFNETAWSVSWGNMPLYAFFRSGSAKLGLIEGGNWTPDFVCAPHGEAGKRTRWMPCSIFGKTVWRARWMRT